MSIFYTYSSDNRGGTREIELHVGNQAGLATMRGNAGQIESLQADGDELEAIRRQFSNIPMHNGRVVEWTGGDAKFIARHLR